MEDMTVRPANALRGTIDLPGDKSISHRAAMLAAMAVGSTRIENFSTARDCQTTIKCLEDLGVSITQDGTGLLLHGVGKTGFRRPEKPLDCGNSGTTMRLLSGILAGQNFQSTLTGDASLQTRPMQRVVDPLERMGARIRTDDGKAPLTISGRNPLRAIEYAQAVASAQIKSCILLAGLNADGETTVIETVATRDHTERMLEWFGVDARTEHVEGGMRISISGNATLTARDVTVPADISSAAFFMIAAACLPGSEISIRNVGVNPTRRAIFDLLCDIGVEATIVDRADACNEPVGTIRIRGGLPVTKKTVVINGPKTAMLIDELPIIAVLGTQLEAGLEVRDARELRSKESDRIAAIVGNLKRMGAEASEHDDGFDVHRSRLKGTVIESFGDHRIAMAFAVAGLLADGETDITGGECADISFPGFFETLTSVVN